MTAWGGWGQSGAKAMQMKPGDLSLGVRAAGVTARIVATKRL